MVVGRDEIPAFGPTDYLSRAADDRMTARPGQEHDLSLVDDARFALAGDVQLAATPLEDVHHRSGLSELDREWWRGREMNGATAAQPDRPQQAGEQVPRWSFAGERAHGVRVFWTLCKKCQRIRQRYCSVR